MNHIRNNENLKNRITNNLDLIFVPIFIILSIIFILLPPYNETPLRIIFALPLLLFMPGYMFIAAMFPKRGELGAIERFTLSIGLSIAITVFDGFGLNYTQWGFRPNSITISLSIIIGIFFMITIIQRWRYGKESYSFSLEDIRSFYYTLKNKETETGPDHDPALEKMLIKTMIIAILIVTSMLIYAKVTQEPEKFTALYILGANGKAENYTTEVSIGETSTILVGVENYEHAYVNYSLIVTMGGINLTREDINLGHGEKWLKNVTFIPELTSSIAFVGVNKSKLEFQLLKDNVSYRSVHLLVNTNLDSAKFAQLPRIVNGDMETNEGWKFFASSPDITGNFRNSINYSSRFARIDFNSNISNNSNNSDNLNNSSNSTTFYKTLSFGKISQNLTTDGTARGLITFDIWDFAPNVSFYVSKQVLLDENVIWESYIGEVNNTWRHVEVPVLLSGNNTLAFRIFSNYKINANATVLFDNVDLKPFSLTKEDIRIKPVRDSYQFDFDIRGEPHEMKRSMIIDGYNFPGFKYDIDRNKSYEKLILDFSNIDPNSSLIGAGNATYIARANGSEINLMGSHFKILGMEKPTNLSRKIEIPGSGKVSLGETLKLGGDYSISVSLISSKGDSAMLSLQKAGSTLDSRLVRTGGFYEYRKSAGKFQVTVFKARIESIIGESITLADMELYSGEIVELNSNSTYGDFEVTNISSDELIFKNSYPIEIKNRTVILAGSMGFVRSGNLLYPYATGVSPRGTPQYTNSNGWMNITGLNYPAFNLRDDTSFEELRMYFNRNGFVEAGNAAYVTRVNSGKMSFLGNNYELIFPDRPGYISNIQNQSQIQLNTTEKKVFEGYNIYFQKIDDHSIQLWVRKLATKNQEELLKKALDSNRSIYSDINYDIMTGRDNNLRKSNTLNIGDTFEYWEEIKFDRYHKKIAGRLETINNSRIGLTIRSYDVPFEILPGKRYGEFEVYTISNDSITLKNVEPLSFQKGMEVPILGGVLKIRTSTSEFLAYPGK
ncbi:MAG: DUF1616 domain-containing protein [Candidatus Methanoperedens sp.]|nr:DUF1616 domain-containing protein [Candidatus Methanoperedens sp.]